MRALTYCLLVVVLTAPCLAADFPVLDGGQKAVIVYGRNASGEGVTAYQDLAAYLKTSTGQDFDVVSERDFDPDCLAALDEAWTRYQIAMTAQT